MQNITHMGQVVVPQSVIDHADTIKYENYKTNKPLAFKKHVVEPSYEAFFKEIASLIQCEPEVLDIVYFSVCKGAKPHTDQLDPNKFTYTTYVIPVILPTGESYITCNDEKRTVELFNMYRFNHAQVHSMTLEDNESGCVVLMIGIRTDKT